MSSKRALRRICANKVAYQTSDGAWAAWKRIDGYGKGLRVYRCSFCKAYHLGHPPGSVQRVRYQNSGRWIA